MENKNNKVVVKPHELNKNATKASITKLLKMLYMILCELVRVTWAEAKPHLLYYYKELCFLLSRVSFNTWRGVAIVGVLVLLWRQEGTWVGRILSPFGGGGRVNYASIADYTTAITAEPTKNEQAPATVRSLNDAENRAYIRDFAQLAVDEMHRSGVPASVSMAQALIESRAGKSRLATAINNHFGIKCFSRSCKRGHCKNFEDDTHKDFFRAFGTPQESWAAHSDFLRRPHYQALFRFGKDYKLWAGGLHKLGYATANGYDGTIIDIIERYNLYYLDNQ